MNAVLRMSTLVISVLLFTVGCSWLTGPEVDQNYRAYSLEGDLLLIGKIDFKRDGEGRLTGTWQTRWHADADTTYMIGDQLGNGTLTGNAREGQLYVDLNPGYYDYNVILRGPWKSGWTNGEWKLYGIGGLRSSGTYKLYRD